MIAQINWTCFFIWSLAGLIEAGLKAPGATGAFSKDKSNDYNKQDSINKEIGDITISISPIFI